MNCPKCNKQGVIVGLIEFKDQDIWAYRCSGCDIYFCKEGLLEKRDGILVFPSNIRPSGRFGIKEWTGKSRSVDRDVKCPECGCRSIVDEDGTYQCPWAGCIFTVTRTTVYRTATPRAVRLDESKDEQRRSRDEK